MFGAAHDAAADAAHDGLLQSAPGVVAHDDQIRLPAFDLGQKATCRANDLPA